MSYFWMYFPCSLGWWQWLTVWPIQDRDNPDMDKRMKMYLYVAHIWFFFKADKGHLVSTVLNVSISETFFLPSVDSPVFPQVVVSILRAAGQPSVWWQCHWSRGLKHLPCVPLSRLWRPNNLRNAAVARYKDKACLSVTERLKTS